MTSVKKREPAPSPEDRRINLEKIVDERLDQLREDAETLARTADILSELERSRLEARVNFDVREAASALRDMSTALLLAVSRLPDSREIPF